MKPTRYYVEYVTRWIEDRTPETAITNMRTLPEARRVYQAHHDDFPQIRERQNIRDATPAGDIPGLIWDYDDELVEDSP